MAELNPPLGTTTPEIFLDNVKRADELVNGPAGTVNDRGGEPLDTWRQMMAKNDEIRQNLIPLSKQYMTLAAAQADIANIPVGSTTYYRSPDDSALAVEVINNAGTLQPTGRQMPSMFTFAGVRFLRGYGTDEFVIIGTDYQVLEYGADSDRLRDAGADIKYGYGLPGKPLAVIGTDGEMTSFLTSDSLQDAGVSILRGYASSPFAVLGADNQLLLMGSGESSAATALPETGLLNYLIAMQERAYTGGFLVIMCGPGDSLTAGTDGLSAIDAMYSLFAANLGHGGIGYFAPSNDNTASRDLLNMELAYTGWVDNQTYGKKCGPLNFALVPWSGRTNLFFRVKDASRSNPIYQHDVVEVGFTGTGDVGTFSQFRFRATDRNDDGAIGPAGSGEWQTATITNQPEGSEEIQIVRVEGLGPASGRFSLEIEPPASGQAGYPAIVSFNCINSAGGVRVIRYARGGATAAYHLNQTASYQKYWMQYFAPDLVFINLGENDYALTDSEFMSGYSAIVERVQDALPGVPVILERWYSDNHIKRDSVYDIIQAKYGMLGFNVRDLIRNSNFAFQNGYAFSTTNPADPHLNARGARIIGAYQAKRALLNYAVQSLRKERQNG
ncbi:TPA: SGNH/GDSL hydrolase family protein [Klebsiella pneumoniae]|uniref:SGNH/GDSL hydrolase family protein n=1 Tax=Klebsiella pneumoniae TaxID=573 RepID=UPI001E38871C|nr:SGNH/GDSL hydrolase family protein [Klebsiella pneumoniae]UHD19084.1 SGNH/GDSL hydrolase family protein [Klebsiella pneumoniae]HBQ8864876.1 SGNH/GDSL hydrolase family protein [Klebsiella pneumoniae]HBQ8870059.1 SGNH/GDSL hydrolase family protein [Klebsiella pneumoniae]HBQ8916479.1 SGNH/GDSL hydrolase family protein [Klebsiella pneumoniae]HBQ8974642.1 SGNH/GDSL hydrolase family protein [Klebsiella pneumoniae]